MPCGVNIAKTPNTSETVASAKKRKSSVGSCWKLSLIGKCGKKKLLQNDGKRKGRESNEESAEGVRAVDGYGR
eukprot:scaffold38761_cov211-Skeletonema_dohrnii-CCMP3373.AAC.2